ncbi:hypothetical protein THOG05_80043 [Vibrio rotiferianus]|uniref:hypothetical protein n=1 Tax=Vibrio rotiferianus TaxID=190895 RepID=UPI002894B844|nr:hypothetical protein THOG05_80043 [Vibrio rotiferianus]
MKIKRSKIRRKLSLPSIPRTYIEDKFWDTISKDDINKNILYYYGIGGVGKTWTRNSLYNKLTSEKDNFKNFTAGVIDFGVRANTPIEHLLDLRVQLEACYYIKNKSALRHYLDPNNYSLKFVVFDDVFERYLNIAGVSKGSLEYSSMLSNLFEKKSSSLANVADWVDNIPKIADSLSEIEMPIPNAMKFLVGVSKQSVEILRNKGIRKKYNNYFIPHEEIIEKQNDDYSIASILAEALKVDICIFLYENPNEKLIFFYDDYHHLQFKYSKEYNNKYIYVEEWLNILLELTNEENIYHVFFSRKKIKNDKDNHGRDVVKIEIPPFSKIEANSYFSSLNNISEVLKNKLLENNLTPFYVCQQYKHISEKSKIDENDVIVPIDELLNRMIGYDLLDCVYYLCCLNDFDRSIYDFFSKRFSNEFLGIGFEDIIRRDFVFSTDGIKFRFADHVVDEIRSTDKYKNKSNILHCNAAEYFYYKLSDTNDLTLGLDFVLSELIYHISQCLNSNHINLKAINEQILCIVNVYNECYKKGEYGILIRTYEPLANLVDRLAIKDEYNRGYYIEIVSKITNFFCRINKMPRQKSDPKSSFNFYEKYRKSLESYKDWLDPKSYVISKSNLMLGAADILSVISNKRYNTEFKLATEEVEKIHSDIKECITELSMYYLSERGGYKEKSHATELILIGLYEAYAKCKLPLDRSLALKQLNIAYDTIDYFCQGKNNKEQIFELEIKRANLFLWQQKVFGTNRNLSSIACNIYEEKLKVPNSNVLRLDRTDISFKWIRAKTYFAYSKNINDNEKLIALRNISINIADFFNRDKSIPVNMIRWWIKAELELYGCTNIVPNIKILKAPLYNILLSMDKLPERSKYKIVWLVNKLIYTSLDWAKAVDEIINDIPRFIEESPNNPYLNKLSRSCKIMIDTMENNDEVVDLLLKDILYLDDHTQVNLEFVKDNIHEIVEKITRPIIENDNVISLVTLQKLSKALNLYLSNKNYTLSISKITESNQQPLNSNATTVLSAKRLLSECFLEMSHRYQELNKLHQSQTAILNAFWTISELHAHYPVLYQEIRAKYNSFLVKHNENKDEPLYTGKTVDELERLIEKASDSVQVVALVDLLKEASSNWDRKNKTHKHKAIRQLWSCISVFDIILTIDSDLRKFMRRKYAIWTYQLLGSLNGFRKHRTPNKYIYPSKSKLDEFEIGEPENFFQDLFKVLGTISVKKKRKSYFPGTILVGSVSNLYEDRVKASTEKNNYIIVENNLLSTRKYKEGLCIGDQLIVNTLKSKAGAYSLATERGSIYCKNILALFFPFEKYPECDNFITGASQSWAVLRTDEEVSSMLLAGNGRLLKLFKDAIGLHRFTLLKKQDLTIAEIRSFISLAWDDLEITGFSSNNLELTLSSNFQRNSEFEFGSESELVDYEYYQEVRKERTIVAMLKKLFPDISINISYEFID